MADVEEIRVYLESHPDDHKQRWRLAKKLYNAWDYRSALEQLLMLQEVWPDRVPVIRYLAATHYRLGKYDEAAAILEKTIALNPDDESLLEQLAKIHEGSGQFENAIEVWKRIAAIKPGPSANEAIDRLTLALCSTSAGPITSGELQKFSTHGGETLKTCPHCGEGNDLFSARCARCHGDMESKTADSNPPEEEAPPFPRGVGIIIVLSVTLACGAAVGLFFWLR